MFKDEIKIESLKMPAKSAMSIGSLSEVMAEGTNLTHTQHSGKVEMKAVVEEMMMLQAEPWPMGGFGG